MRDPLTFLVNDDEILLPTSYVQVWCGQGAEATDGPCHALRPAEQFDAVLYYRYDIEPTHYRVLASTVTDLPPSGRLTIDPANAAYEPWGHHLWILVRITPDTPGRILRGAISLQTLLDLLPYWSNNGVDVANVVVLDEGEGDYGRRYSLKLTPAES